MQKPTKINAFLVCDKCGRIINRWQDTCPSCNHDLMNVCLNYQEAKALSVRVRPKSQATRSRAYRRRQQKPRTKGPRILRPLDDPEPLGSSPALNRHPKRKNER